MTMLASSWSESLAPGLSVVCVDQIATPLSVETTRFPSGCIMADAPGLPAVPVDQIRLSWPLPSSEYSTRSPSGCMMSLNCRLGDRMYQPDLRGVPGASPAGGPVDEAQTAVLPSYTTRFASDWSESVAPG